MTIGFIKFSASSCDEAEIVAAALESAAAELGEVVKTYAELQAATTTEWWWPFAIDAAGATALALAAKLLTASGREDAHAECRGAQGWHPVYNK